MLVTVNIHQTHQFTAWDILSKKECVQYMQVAALLAVFAGHGISQSHTSNRNVNTMSTTLLTEVWYGTVATDNPRIIGNILTR